MGTQLIKLAGVAAGLAAVTLLGLITARATAESHPQEVLDLISAHQALAMKIRPLHDRVRVAAAPKEGDDRFKPEGVPIRAKTSAATSESNTGAEGRASETLRHKDRAASSGDDYGRIKVRLLALEDSARAERERVNRPRFGIGLVQHDSESGDVRFGDGHRGGRSTSATEPQHKPGAGAAENNDAKEIADARKALAALQREFAALELEVNALGRR